MWQNVYIFCEFDCRTWREFVILGGAVVCVRIVPKMMNQNMNNIMVFLALGHSATLLKPSYTFSQL